MSNRKANHNKNKRKKRNARNSLKRKKREDSSSPKKLSEGQKVRKLINATTQKRKYQVGGLDWLDMQVRREEKKEEKIANSRKLEQDKVRGESSKRSSEEDGLISRNDSQGS